MSHLSDEGNALAFVFDPVGLSRSSCSRPDQESLTVR